jgi:hypothetical protein
VLATFWHLHRSDLLALTISDAFVGSSDASFDALTCWETAVIFGVQADVDEMVAAVGFSSLQVISALCMLPDRLP